MKPIEALLKSEHKSRVEPFTHNRGGPQQFHGCKIHNRKSEFQMDDLGIFRHVKAHSDLWENRPEIRIDCFLPNV